MVIRPDGKRVVIGTARPARLDRAQPALLPIISVVSLISVATLAAYSNCIHNAFQLDDGYGLVQNVWIHSLWNIPRFFVDPFTLTAHRSNADYRPILQITYALNYAISGPDTGSWHVLNMVLHIMVATHVFLLGRILLGTRRIVDLPWLPAAHGDWISLGAAMLFAVHPITAGCVNYLWARSSLLTAVFILPATVLYLRGLATGKARSVLPALLLYALGLLTKAEAISFLGIAVLADLLFARRLASPAARKGSRYVASLQRLAPFVLVTAAYLGLRQLLIPQFVVDARHSADVTTWPYFLTQLRAWWHYVGQMIAPLRLVADETGYPVSRSMLEGRLLLALGGWVIVGGFLLFSARRAPALAFLGLSFFVHLAPHSSFSPLAEMVNEHRPYLPDTGLFLLACLLLWVIIARVTVRPRVIFAGLVLALMVPLTVLTRQRNLVFRDELSFWGDIVTKSPQSSRAQMNFGLLLMQRNQLPEAEARFRESLWLAPNYHFAHTNLAIVLHSQGDIAGARREHDEAVRLGRNEESPYYYRGMFRKSQDDLAGAITDFRMAVQFAAQPGRSQQELEKCLRVASTQPQT